MAPKHLLVSLATLLLLIEACTGKPQRPEASSSRQKRDTHPLPHPQQQPRHHVAPPPPQQGYQQVFIRPLDPYANQDQQQPQPGSYHEPGPYDQQQVPDYSVPQPQPRDILNKGYTTPGYGPPTTTPGYGTTTTPHAGYGAPTKIPPAATGYGTQQSNLGPEIPAYAIQPQQYQQQQHQQAASHKLAPSTGYGTPSTTASPYETTPNPYKTTTTPRSSYGAPIHTPYKNQQQHQAIALQPVVDGYGRTIGYLIPASAVRPDGPSVFAIVPNNNNKPGYGNNSNNNNYRQHYTTTTTTTTTPPPYYNTPEPQYSLVPASGYGTYA